MLTDWTGGRAGSMIMGDSILPGVEKLGLLFISSGEMVGPQGVML